MPWTPPNDGNGGKGPVQGPWGQIPRPPGGGGSGGGGGSEPPNFDDVLERMGQFWRGLAPHGGLSGPGIVLLVLAGLLLWAFTGFYTVGANEVGLNLHFGRYIGKTGPGLNYNWPYPAGSVVKLPVTDRNSIDIGERTGRGGTAEDVPSESLMLTGDENIADVKFRVIWQIDPAHPEDYAFNLANRVGTVKAVAESSMREIVGKSEIQKLLTVDRTRVESQAQDLTQATLDQYKAGILILQVQLLSVDPPQQVIAAFKDVTAAQQDMQRLQTEADAYRNKVVPEARGAAAAIVQSAKAYREQTVAQATGEASRFSQIDTQYKLAPDLTRQRLYLETMETVLGGAKKIILDPSVGKGAVPYLPLNQIFNNGAAK